MARRFEDAAGHFGRAIALDGRCEVYFSNRAAALTALKRYAEALEDAHAVVRLKPNWAKGWARLGAAHVGLEQHGEVRRAQATHGPGCPLFRICMRGKQSPLAALQPATSTCKHRE